MNDLNHKLQEILWGVGCGNTETISQLTEVIRDVIHRILRQHVTYTAIDDNAQLPQNTKTHVIYHSVEAARRHFKDSRVDIITRMVSLLENNIIKDLSSLNETNETLLNEFHIEIADDYTPANENHAQAQDLIQIKCSVDITVLPRTNDDTVA
jgi:hypothetical protein